MNVPLQATGSTPSARSASWRMLTDTMTVSFWTFAGKLAGAAKLVIAARAFGAGDAMDAYLVAFVLPSFFADVLAGPLDGAFIPTFLEVRAREGPGAAERLSVSVSSFAFTVLLLGAMVMAGTSGFLIAFLGSGFSSIKVALTQRFLILMLPLMPLSALAVSWRSVLTADRRFAFCAMVPAITPLLSIAALLIGGRRYGVWALAVGSLAGAICEAALLAWGMWRAGHSILPRWIRSPEGKVVIARYSPLVAVTLVMTGSTLIDQAAAARLSGGSVAILNYGTRLVGVLMAVGPIAVGTVVLPHISESIGRNQIRDLGATLRRYGLFLLFIVAPLIALLMYVSELIIRLAFHLESSGVFVLQTVTSVQRVSLLQVPIALLLVLEVRLMSAMKKNQLLYMVAGLSLALTLLLDLLLPRWWGVVGIPWAGILVRLVSALYLSCKIWGFRTIRSSFDASHTVS